MPLKLRKVRLGECNAELDDMVGRCRPGLRPSLRVGDGLLHLVHIVPGGDRSYNRGEDKRKPGRERPHVVSEVGPEVSSDSEAGDRMGQSLRGHIYW